MNEDLCILLVRLKSLQHEFIAYVKELDEEYDFRLPMGLSAKDMGDSNGNVRIGFVPLISPLAAKGTEVLRISKSEKLWFCKPSEEIENYYRQSTGSIVIPSLSHPV